MKKSKNTLLITSCIFAMFGVAMGAIGKHWAEGFLLAKQLKTLSTATFYHQIYSILILILS